MKFNQPTWMFIAGLLVVAALMFFAGRLSQDNEYGQRLIDANNNLHDYQIELVPAVDYKTAPDSVQLWDGKRLVGIVPIIRDSPIDTLIMADNQ